MQREDLEAELGEPITLDGLTAAWSIFQRKKGHRHSTDDLLTGWYAVEHGGSPSAILDLGAGIGTVGMLALSCAPETTRLVSVEAQAISYRFLTENVALNGLQNRITTHHQDLREFVSAERFPLVTGSPPYFDVKTGIVPEDSQKAHARFELRGDVSDYAKAAKRHLQDGAPFIFCFPYAQKERAVRLVRDVGFGFERHRDVVPRVGLTPLFSLFVARLGSCSEIEEPPFVVREEDGAHTPAMKAVRARFGWPV